MKIFVGYVFFLWKKYIVMKEKKPKIKENIICTQSPITKKKVQ